MRANHKLAQQLKEAGYDVPCDKYFTVQDGRITPRTSFSKMDYNNYNDKSKPYWTRPTLHEITDWLREVKGVHVNISPNGNFTSWWVIVLQKFEGAKGGRLDLDKSYPDHDTALTAAIEAALLILKNKSK